MLREEFEVPTVKQRLAAVRVLLDWLVTGGVLRSNPAASVRGPKHSVHRGKTPVLDGAEVGLASGLARLGIMPGHTVGVMVGIALAISSAFSQCQLWELCSGTSTRAFRRNKFFTQSITRETTSFSSTATCDSGRACGCASRPIHQNDVYMPITPMFHVHAWGPPYVATIL